MYNKKFNLRYLYMLIEASRRNECKKDFVRLRYFVEMDPKENEREGERERKEKIKEEKRGEEKK